MATAQTMHVIKNPVFMASPSFLKVVPRTLCLPDLGSKKRDQRSSRGALGQKFGPFAGALRPRHILGGTSFIEQWWVKSQGLHHLDARIGRGV
jgi:hypothetical protein